MTIQSEAQTVSFIQTNIANPGDPILNAGGQTFTLTTSQDVLAGTGGPDTFNGFTVAPGDTQTLNNSDRLDGKAGNDTLNATLNGGTTSPTLSAIELINVQALAGSTLSLLNVTGATKLVDNSSGGFLTVNNAGALADYGISNTKQSMTVNDLTAKTITLAATNAGTTGTTANVTSNVNLNTTATTGGLTKVTATVENSHIFIDAGTAGAGKGMTELDIVSNGTANEVGHSNVSNVKTVVVTGSAKLDLTVNTSNYASATTLTAGDGGVTFSNTGSVATAFAATTGAGADTLTLRGGNLTSASTGGGADTVTLANDAASATTKVDLGDGDDALVLNVLPTTGALLNGGAGTDTVRMDSALAAVASAGTTFQDTISNFEKVRINAVQGGATDTVNLANLDGISYLRSAGTGASTGTAEVQTYTFGAADATGGQITFGGVNIPVTYSESGNNIAAAVAAQQAAIIAANPNVASVTANTNVVTVTYNVLPSRRQRCRSAGSRHRRRRCVWRAGYLRRPGTTPVGEGRSNRHVGRAPAATGYYFVGAVQVNASWAMT